MEWSRAELKSRAKFSLKGFFWKSVLVGFVLSLISGDISLDLTSAGTDAGNYTDTVNQVVSSVSGMGGMALAILGLGTAVIMLCVVIGLLVQVFLIGPLTVGCKRYFVNASEGNADLGDMGYCFKNGYTNVVLVQFLTDIFLFLWTLLLIVPGIIKSYSYRMIPYLLAEDPMMSFTEAKERSIEMMDGEKWDTFVLDLSFILWFILSVFTLGLVGIFWVNPYYEFTCAEQYKVLSMKGQPDVSCSQTGYEM